ncbi:MAG: IS5 family transposase [Muribaculaceae bacterium]
MTFDEMKGSLERLPKTNRWVQMGDALPWTEYEKVYNKRLKNDAVGASNRPGRMAIAALIIKHRLGLSDEETILAIQENPYMQYMCGLTEYTDQPIFDPSLFTTIRKRITIEDINALTLELAKKSREKTAKEHKDNNNDGGIPSSDSTRPTDLKADATCADAEVRYPTDIDLIEDGSQYIGRMIDKVCGIKKIRKPTGIERPRIRDIYLNVIKRKHKGAKLIKDAITRMLPLLYRDILTLLNLIGIDDETYGRFNRTQKRTIQAVIDMYHQQETMLRLGTHTCENRIVSIHQPHIRPIVRGKAKAKVEFGAKIGVSMVNGYSFIDHHSWEAYNEASDLQTHIDRYKERFGCEPKRFFGDKIYLNRDNRKTLKEKGIEIMGRPLGRPPKNPTEEQLERERIGISLRNEAEAQFGTGKRAYRANNIRARLPETAECWTAMCYFVRNLTKFMSELCLVLIEICARIRHFGSNFINSSVKIGVQPCGEHLVPARGLLTC